MTQILALATAVLISALIQHVSSAAVRPSPLFYSTSSRLLNLHVKCDKTGLLASLTFNQPFPGVIYSLGYHAVPSCNYVNASTPSSANTYTFFVAAGRCGTEGRYSEPKPGEKVVIKNTIVIQHDADFITAEDSAHALSCTWADTYVKPVSTKPVTVQDDANKVISVVLDPISTQSGQVIKRHHNSLAAGVLETDKEKNVIISVMDPLNQYDVMVLDCMAFDGDNGNAVALTDKNGCMLQLNLLPPFKKTRTPGVSLTLHSTIKDFRLTQVPNLRVKCNIEVCGGQCRPACQLTTSDVNDKNTKTA